MARIATASPVASPSDQLDAELGQLLKRMQHSILYVDADREHALRTSEIEREKAERNLAYARGVLTRLEQESMGLRAHILKQDVQCDLNRRREALEVLMDRMHDLSKAGVEEDDEDEMETDSQDDILADIIPTPSESMDSTSADHSRDPGEQDDTSSAKSSRQAIAANPTQPSEPSGTQLPTTEPGPMPILTPPTITTATATDTPSTEPAHTPPPTTTTQAVRPRRNLQPRPSSRAALLSRKTPSAPHTQSATTEALLDRERADQDTLIEGILGYASALKDSTQRFHDSLDKDKSAMERAAEGVERAGAGMEGTRKLMGTLQRMSEGKGWWGRMGLYVWVYGLMVFLVFMVFTFPKLRF